MAGPEVVIVRTGTANLASVRAGFERLGARTRLLEEASELEQAERVMLPGVGSFAGARAELARSGLLEPLKARLDEGRPTMAICVGLQLLCQDSDESPGVAGLGVVPSRVSRFSEQVCVPQMGWNLIEPAAPGRFLRESGYAYFANSYRLSEAPEGWNVALSDHGGRFVAAIERGAVLACQFHPELSGAFGLEILRRWLEQGEEEC